LEGCDDALAVLDAAGAERATCFDMTTRAGGVILAATYPDRLRSLICDASSNVCSGKSETCRQTS
jgi:hypothetical protein